MRKGERRQRHKKDNRIDTLTDSLVISPISSIMTRRHTRETESIKLTLDERCSYEQGLIEAIFSSVPGLLYLYTEEGTLVGWNNQHEEMTGYDASELKNFRAENWFDEHDRLLLAKEWPKVFSEGKRELELNLIRKDQKAVPYLFTGVRVELNGKPHLVGIGIDMTEKRERESALRKAEQIFKRAEEIAHVGSWQFDFVSNHILLSDELYRIFGLPVGQAIKYNCFLSVVHPDDRQKVDVAWKRALRKESLDIEYRLDVDGQLKWVFQRTSVEFNSQGVPVQGTGIVHDITERKKHEEERERALTEIKKLTQQVEAENAYLRKKIDDLQEVQDSVIGNSDAMCYVRFRAQQVAQTDATVLLLGETGTGKGLIARFIHRIGVRSEKPLVTVNCAGLPRELIESELFGREKGAFTGAQNAQIGRFELANGGTVFLDEIAELPVDLQVKLLRVIEDGEFERLGSPHTVRVNVQIIAATNRDLRQEIAKGTFREDLFWRINVFPITIPPLRERKQDIPHLANFFLERCNDRFDRKVKMISEKQMGILRAHNWPGNVRELMGVIERSVISSQGDTLNLHLPEGLPVIHSGSDPGVSGKAALALVEKDHIVRCLKASGWVIEGSKGAASLLGLQPSTLRHKMKKLGVTRPANQQ